MVGTRNPVGTERKRRRKNGNSENNALCWLTKTDT